MRGYQKILIVLATVLIVWLISRSLRTAAQLKDLAQAPKPYDIYIFALTDIFFQQEHQASVAFRSQGARPSGRYQYYLFCLWRKSTENATEFQCARESQRSIDAAIDKAMKLRPSDQPMYLGEKPVRFPAIGADILAGWGVRDIIRSGEIR